MQAERRVAPQLQAPHLPYMPGLDGLRALAVIAVLLYHADLGASGGYLGVETFFVLSGFLITALLRAEWEQQGRVNLVDFWLRRARRLLPALFVVLGGVLLLAAVLLPGELAALRADALAALAYVMNWRLVLSQQSYFDAGLRPSLLQHLWSLAVEEQFYLLWPLLFMLAMRWLGRRGTLALALAGVVASTLAMALLFDPGADPSRLYYGTDTRAAGLLLGAALALAWSPAGAAASARRGRALDAAGALALGGLLLAYAGFSEAHPLLYRGGFLAIALVTTLLIVAATHPAARLLPRLLGVAPLRWVGQRSYGMYLWHWPVFMLTRPGLDVPISGWPLLALRFGLVLLLTELSFRYVEQPVRRGALGRWWRGLRTPPIPAARPTVPALAMAMVLLGACAVPPATPADLPTEIPLATIVPTIVPTNAPSSTPLLVPTAPPTAEPTATPEPTATAEPTAAPTEAATSAPVATVDPALAERLQAILDELVADGTIPGAVLSVSIPGQGVWNGASGVSDRAAATAMTTDTRLRIASISKVFTAVVVLQLVEEGVIALDDPMAKWLPDLVPAGERITVRNLLQHTTGLYDYLEDRSYVGKVYSQPERVFTSRELVEYAASKPALFKPGAKGGWDYSSTNFVILGMIVESATGNTLADEMRARIFTPLKLTSTYFAPDEPVEGVAARGYSGSTDQSAAAMSFAFATANIVSRPDDVRRFAEALFGGKLLQPAMLDQMLQFVNGKGQYKMPALEYGLGVMRNKLAVGPAADGQARSDELKTVMGHIGGFGGFRSAVWHAPATGITIALGENQGATDPNILATRVFDTVLAGIGK